MLRRTVPATMRVLCLTMLPDGGAMMPALKQLGYEPYSLKSSFQQGHASTHPLIWAQLLEGKAAYDKKPFGGYDCFVGPPAAVVYDTVLRSCPAYTKVILVEEPEKQQWADSYDEYMTKLQKAMKRASKNKITLAFNTMLDRMVVRGTAVTEPEGVSESIAKHNFRSKSSTTSDLRRALGAEDSRLRGGKAPTRSGTNVEADDDAVDEADGTVLSNPRAFALLQYEESVKMSVPTSRLLVYRHGDGWEPLCRFLERPVPVEPFPPYDSGLSVLGNLQERIARAELLLRGLGVLCALIACAVVYPRLGIISSFFTGIVQDYRVAFGDDESPAKPSTSDAFEDVWRSRGGTVVTTRPSLP